MVPGGAARVKQIRETCIFCAFRSHPNFFRGSRRIHLSGRRLRSTETLATQDSNSTGLFETRYSGSSSASKSASPVDQNHSSVYGNRYTSKETPSWRKKSQEEERRRNIVDQASVSSSRDTASSFSSQSLKTPHSGNVYQSRPGSGIRRLNLSSDQETSKADQQSWVSGSGRNTTRRFQFMQQPSSADTGSKVQGITQAPKAVSSSETFNYTSRGRDQPRQRISNSRNSEEPRTSISNGINRGVFPDHRNLNTYERTSETWKNSTNIDQAHKGQYEPSWTKLTTRSRSSPRVDASIGNVPPFQPSESIQRLPKSLDSVDKESVENGKFLSFSNSTSDRALGSLKSTASDKARFQNKHDVTQNKPSSDSEITRKAFSKFTSQEPQGDSFSKDRRRRVLWEEDELEQGGKRTKPKSLKQRDEGGGIDESELDPKRLARIEEKRRRKAAEKLAREDRASGQTFIVPSFISINNLAIALKIRGESFSKVLRSQGFSELSRDHVLDAETAGLIAQELGFKAVLPAKDSEIDLVAQSLPENTDFLPPRPPVVTIMGHVDHGKTTLLDWLRKSSIAASEHGGITQHIGAFTVQMPTGRIITFLDTPGHAAFLEMRARGANVTDIVILVVAADDSVKPQTIEAIKHAKAARTQIVVAISKVDKPEADPDRVKQDLARNGIEVEDYGGDTQTVNVSGKTGEGMDKLEDAVIALADILDVKADPTASVEGWVLEGARSLSGKVATVLVRCGTLRLGQIIVAGQTWARIRTLRDEAGAEIEEALPGTPVEVEGWNMQPEAGAEVLQAPNEQRARRVVDYRIGKAQVEKQAAEVANINEARRLHDQQRAEEKVREFARKRGEVKIENAQQESKPGFTEVPVIIKADVSGSVEAVNASVLGLGNSEVRPNVVHSAVGSVTRSDIERATAVQGCIVSFNVSLEGEIIRLAERAGIKIIDGNIIYRIVDDVKVFLEEKLPPRITHHVTGEADVLQVFEIGLKGKKTLPVAGCRIRNGTITKGSNVKIVRHDRIIYDGLLSTLKNVKKDVTEMRKGNECGISFEDFKDFVTGDQIQCYEIKSEKRYL